ncbi:potassium channel family protein [Atopobacter phocae]|uniref:potassium channel family protein n=1 Tax=Atopobacter phocae TaxID=136492 RepID=UPI0004B6830A|nr:TrkA family potassium uptake protein [Atopobacter phocae]
MSVIKTIGVLGLGVFGTSIVRTLSQYNCNIIAVDMNPKQVDQVADLATEAVIGDITDDALLKEIGIDLCDAVVIAIGESLEASVLAIMHVKKMGIKEIIAKAKGRTGTEILYEIGATKVVQPEKETGRRVARKVLHSKVSDVILLDDTISIVEFHSPSDWINQTIVELDTRGRHGINIIGYRNRPGGRMHVNITPDFVVLPNHIFIGIADTDAFEKFERTTNLD